MTNFFHRQQSSIDAQPKGEDRPAEKATEILSKLFEDESMFTKAPSRLIVSGSGGGPFAHLSYPVGGIHPVNARRNLLQTNQQLSADFLPDVIPGQFPQIEEIPASRTSPAPGRRSVELTETVVELPPPSKNQTSKAKGDSVSSNEGPSEKVREFLSRVPDLSFMLSSKLSLPADK